jgi:AAA domain
LIMNDKIIILKPHDKPAMPGEQIEVVEPKVPEPRFKFETMTDLRSMPAQEYLIDGWIPERSVGLLYGRWGTGKSFVVDDWALHLAYGLPDWHGARLPGAPCHVLIVAREGHAGFVKRIDAFKAHHRIEADPDHLIFLRSSISFADDSAFAALKEDVTKLKRPFRFVLVDTVGRVLPGVEMSKEAPITLFMERLQQLGEVTRGTAVGVHHENKAGDANGSMFFQNSSDFMFNVEREGEGPLQRGKITCVKSKDDSDMWSRGIRFAKIELPAGKSSLVVESIFEDEKPKVSKEPELTKDEATFYRILYDAGKKGLTVEEWNKAAREAGLGVKRRADLTDFRTSLRDKKRAREYAGIWKVSHDQTGERA